MRNERNFFACGLPRAYADVGYDENDELVFSFVGIYADAGDRERFTWCTARSRTLVYRDNSVVRTGYIDSHRRYHYRKLSAWAKSKLSDKGLYEPFCESDFDSERFFENDITHMLKQSKLLVFIR